MWELKTSKKDTALDRVRTDCGLNYDGDTGGEKRMDVGVLELCRQNSVTD